MTTPTSRVPQLHADMFDCPRCSAFSGHKWKNILFDESDRPGSMLNDSPDSYVVNREGPSRKKNASEADESRWRASRCEYCRKWTVWRGDQVIYPPLSPAPLPHKDMPEAVETIYNEARAVAAASRRAGAALARAALERLLKELDEEAPANANLDDRIARVTRKVNTSTAKLLTVCRHVGNKSLHDDVNPDDAVVLLLTDADSELMEVIFESINLVVDDLISRPALVDDIYDKVPAGVRESAEAKAKKAT